ncbi:MAG: hypothetical protein GY884_30600 [Proteobacteria bacterium]|nr:hypothetical protein [Pseudomonadota bacterium]
MILALLLQVTPASAQGPVGAAVLLAARGDVQLREPDLHTLVLGERFGEGSLVCTGPESFATVRLAVSIDGGQHDDVTLLPETCLRVVTTASHPSTRESVLSLESGSVTLRAVDEGDSGSVVVETSSGTTRGEGGGFRVHIEQGAARTEALYNGVSVEGAGKQVQVDAGFGTRVRAGEIPQVPQKLPDPGTPTAPTDLQVLRVADFSWRPVPEALAYRIEFATTEDFSDLLMADEAPTALYEPELLFLPFRIPGLHWRVTSVDKYGFMGIPSDPRELRFPAGVGP